MRRFQFPLAAPLAALLAAPLAAPLAGSLACGTRTTAEPAPVEPAARPSPATTDHEELRAFARLYGYVRYFHPSDEAAALDWEGFAIHGVQQVTAAQTRDQLAQILRDLFAPVAPTLDVYPEGDTPREASALFPADTEGLDVVAWQHRGYGFGDMVTAYSAARTHRTRQAAQGPWRTGTVSQEVDAKPLRGQRIRMRAWARVDPSAPAASVRPALFIEGRDDRTRREFGPAWLELRWTELTVEAEVPDDATEIELRLDVTGQGAAWLDDVSLEQHDGAGWHAVALDNPGFEEHESRARRWDTEPDNFEVTVGTQAHGGERAVRVARKLGPGSTELFEATPEPGELFTAALGARLQARIPLSLYSRDGRTLGPPGAAPVPAPPDLTGVPRSPEDPAVRGAAVVVAWNVFQHFYPYFDVVQTDWAAVLDQGLHRVREDATPLDTFHTLQWMVAQLDDGHGQVMSPAQPEERGVPAELLWAEDQVVVGSVPEGSPLQRGDVLLAIDDEDVMERVRDLQSRISGSPQWKQFRVLAWGTLTRGAEGSMARLRVRRGEQEQVVEVERRFAEVPPVFEHEPIEQLEGGVWFVDLARAEWSELHAKIDPIAAAPGVVFDLRGYPNSTHPVLRHLMTEPEEDRWMFVAEIIYPDHERITGWQEHGWDMTPAAPHIEGKVAFITGGGAVSYAESVMGYVEGLHLGEIVGSPTAGANGNINPFTTPGGYTIYSTGMKVLKHDGSTHHVVGVQPTVPAAPTVAGIRQGRDELLERALAVVTEG